MKRRELWALLAVSFLVRGLAAALGHRLVGYSGDGLYDDGIFIRMAQSFLGRDPETFITHPPGLPLLLAPFLMIPGAAGATLARFAIMLLGASLAPMTVVLAEYLSVAAPGALAAGALAAASPLLVYFSTRFMSEIPFTVLVVAFFLVWIKAWRQGSLSRAAACGVIGGLASLTRTTFMPFGGALALAAFLRRRNQPRWLSMILACGAVWAATIAPWTARNWARFHRLIPISAQGGWNFYEGLAVGEDETSRRPIEMAQEAREHGVSGIFESNAYFAEKAKREIAADPGWFAALCARKAFKFWRVLPYYPRGLAARAAIGLFTACAFALALFGLRRLPIDDGWAFALAWAVFLTLMHSVFASALRYRLPLEPFVFAAAGAGLNALARRR